MNGIKYLLDTNFILGMLKKTPEVLNIITSRSLVAHECAYSSITRMELLGFPGITKNEESLIREKLEYLTYISITPSVEDTVIQLRRTKKLKLPDAIIAATALVFQIELLTLDQQLLSGL